MIILFIRAKEILHPENKTLVDFFIFPPPEKNRKKKKINKLLCIVDTINEKELERVKNYIEFFKKKNRGISSHKGTSF